MSGVGQAEQFCFFSVIADSARQHYEEIKCNFSHTVMLCAKTCDRCGRHAKTVVDDIEFNEFLSVNHLAGYGSIFGDSNRLKLDLCQHCLKDVLGQWITVCDQ